MNANDVRHIDPARRSGLALRAARWALNFSKSETSFYTTPICCPQGSPLSPRQRYVRRQSEQADNQGFPKKVTVTFLSYDLWYLTLKWWQSPFCPLPHDKNTNLSGFSYIYCNNLAKNYAGGTGVAGENISGVPCCRRHVKLQNLKVRSDLTTETPGPQG